MCCRISEPSTVSLSNLKDQMDFQSEAEDAPQLWQKNHNTSRAWGCRSFRMWAYCKIDSSIAIPIKLGKTERRKNPNLHSAKIWTTKNNPYVEQVVSDVLYLYILCVSRFTPKGSLIVDIKFGVFWSWHLYLFSTKALDLLLETNGLPLKIAGWETMLFCWDCLFSRAMLVSGRVKDWRSDQQTDFFGNDMGHISNFVHGKLRLKMWREFSCHLYRVYSVLWSFSRLLKDWISVYFNMPFHT